MRDNDATQSNVMEMKTDATKHQNDAVLVRAVICCRIIYCSFPLPLQARCVRIINNLCIYFQFFT